MAISDRTTGGSAAPGRQRPAFAVTPDAGQESVWDYPRPPRIAADDREVLVRAGGLLVARTVRAVRVLETASPPTFYLPLADITPGVLVPAAGSSYCEWKGRARYWSVRAGDRLFERVGWSYPEPLPGFEAIAQSVAFYATTLECFVDGERVRPQPGRFYGGWITNEVVGPFKGEPGTLGW